MPNLTLACSRKGLHILAAALYLPATTLFAQDAPEVPDTVQVTLEGFTLTPAVTDTGAPMLDDEGVPVMERITLDESVITPGDQVLYVITLNNPTDEPAENLQLGVQVAAELLLDPDSFVGPEDLVIEWADVENLTEFLPIFVEVDGETLMQANLETLRALRLTLPELPPSEDVSVEYTVTLR